MISLTPGRSLFVLSGTPSRMREHYFIQFRAFCRLSTIELTNPPLTLPLVLLEHTAGVPAPQENLQCAHHHPTRPQEPAAHQSKAVGNVELRNSAVKIVMSALWS